MSTSRDADLMALAVHIIGTLRTQRPKRVRIMYGLLVTLRHGDEAHMQAAWEWMQQCAEAQLWGKDIPPFPE